MIRLLGNARISWVFAARSICSGDPFPNLTHSFLDSALEVSRLEHVLFAAIHYENTPIQIY